MRRTTIAILGAAVLAIAGCGSGKPFANKPRPPIPINLTVYINDSRISVSPTSLGAGPIVLIVTNQSSRAQSLRVQTPGSQTALAETGPINPQANAQVKLDVSPGDYDVAAEGGGSSQAAQAVASSIPPAHLHVGPPRPSASDQLLQP